MRGGLDLATDERAYIGPGFAKSVAAMKSIGWLRKRTPAFNLVLSLASRHIEAKRMSGG